MWWTCPTIIISLADVHQENIFRCGGEKALAPCWSLDSGVMWIGHKTVNQIFTLVWLLEGQWVMDHPGLWIMSFWVQYSRPYNLGESCVCNLPSKWRNTDSCCYAWMLHSLLLSSLINKKKQTKNPSYGNGLQCKHWLNGTTDCCLL